MTLVSNVRDDNNTVTLEIRVDGEVFAAAMEKAYRKGVRSINVPGFRKGKAPRAIIEKMYGKEVFVQDAVNLSYSEAYKEAAKEADLHPVDTADIDIKSADYEGYTFEAKVVVKPEVKISDYTGLKADKTVKTASDADVEAEINRMKERVSRMVEVTDRAVADGDTVTIDYSGSVDGVKFEGGTAEKQNLVIGSNQFIPGFEEQVIGHSIGEEFDLTVKFPEEYHAEELAGKDAVFHIVLHEIKTKEYPAMDDEFAKDVSEFDTLDALKADILKKAQEGYDHQAENELDHALMDQLAEKLEANIPQVMFEKAIDSQIDEMDYRLQSQGMNLQMYLQYTGSDMAKLRESMKEGATEQVKVRLALEAVAAAEKLDATTEEVDAEYNRIAEQYHMKAEEIRRAIPEEDIRADLLVGKASDFVKEHATITEVADDGKKAAKKPAAKKTTKKAESDASDAEEKTSAKKPAAKKATKKAESKDAE